MHFGPSASKAKVGVFCPTSAFAAAVSTDKAHIHPTVYDRIIIVGSGAGIHSRLTLPRSDCAFDF